MEPAMTDTIDESTGLGVGAVVSALVIAAVVAIGLAVVWRGLSDRREPLESVAVDAQAAEVAVATEEAVEEQT
jgi:hypothetical protein